MTTMQQTPWAKGDFHVIGAAQTLVGELLCDDAGLTAGMRVLDIACGSGNTALAAARRGAHVTGIDIVPALIERAGVRSRAEGFEIEFLTGNAESLPFEDESFDMVLSTFGIMFAPDQARAAEEALRVCKPGGKLAFANWVPESMPGAMFAHGMKYNPMPGPHAPIEWGTVSGLKRLFHGKVHDTRLTDRLTYSRAPDSASMLAMFKTYFGPAVMLYERAPAELHAQLDRELQDIYNRYNRAADGTLMCAMQFVDVIMTKGTG